MGRLPDEVYERLKKKCGHPPESRVPYVRKRNGVPHQTTRCKDCHNEYYRGRPRRKKQQETTRAIKVNGAGTPPSDEVLSGALCGDTADDRFVMLPTLLSEDDRDELNRWCSNCPVRMGCFQWALENRHFIGVAGAHTFGTNKTGKRVIEPLRAQEGAA